jgi:hypothetical protein
MRASRKSSRGSGLPQGKPEGGALSPFFRALRASVLDAWTSREGYAYDRVIYAVGYPYRKGDLERVLAFAGRKEEAKHFPPLGPLNRLLIESRYPELARLAPKGVSVEAWSAVLHFLDPSYPLAKAAANEALVALGFNLPARLKATDYPAFVAALDVLKEKAPMWAVPETNWYLARVLEVGLGAFAPSEVRGTRAGSRASA